MVVNKSDILEGPAQVAEIRSFVADNARALLGFEPDIFFVSAKLALRAKRGEPSVWAASGFEALEHYVATTLNASGRAQLKLLNPTRRRDWPLPNGSARRCAIARRC